MSDGRDALFIGQASDGRTVRRPMSPHIQVYRPQLTSVLSIMNRMSGIAISFGTILMVWWLVAASEGPKAFTAVQWFAGSVVGIAMLVGWTRARCYHTFGGIRHLLWDAGIGFSLPATHRSGWMAVAATAVCTVAIVAAGLATWL